MPRQRILVFDSGLGGLTVHAEVAKLLPEAEYAYVADDAAFPYGDLSAKACAARVVYVIGRAIDRFRPDICVIACNTASTVALPDLRATFQLPFVGTVPAVKPAAERSRTRTISILGTPGTVSREYTHDLIIQHAADCRVTLVGAGNLARLAEQHLRGEPVEDRDVLAEIEPCFREKDGVRTDAVALACTHYPLLLDVYRRIAPWEVAWIDPAPAIARRVAQVLPPPPSAPPPPPKTFKQRLSVFAKGIRPEPEAIDNSAYFTSDEEPAAPLAAALAARGLRPERGFRLIFP
jgi:glutamate racemase